MILGTTVSYDGCITEYKQAVTQCMCRAAFHYLINWARYSSVSTKYHGWYLWS